MTEKASQPQLLLSDHPLDSLKIGDAFGHIIYSETLADILAKTDNSKGYAIGLFGSWGVGKTSIIRHLKNSNTDSSLKIIELDAWQYSAQHFRREFLLTITTKENHKKIRGRILYKSRKVFSGPPKIDKKQLFEAVLLIVLAGLGTALLSKVALDYFASITVAVSTIMTVTVGILSSITTMVYAAGLHNIKGLFSNVETTIEKEIPIHPDEFQALFTEILDKKPYKGKSKLVFVIDNLDRAAHETVVEILSSIKTFLLEKRCVFVIPCDHQGLVNHIAASRSQNTSIGPTSGKTSANEYLRKFFYTSIQVRPFLPDDLTSFIENKIAQLAMFTINDPIQKVALTAENMERNRSEVFTVIRIGARLNPRKIIHLLNRLAGEYVLIQNIAKVNTSLSQRLSENLGFLAKLGVIEEEWPRFYRMITTFPEILDQVNRFIRTGGDEDKRRALSYMGQHESGTQNRLDDNLIEFLRGTLLIKYDDIREIVFFKQSVIDREIEGARRLGILARNARFKSIEDIFDGATAEQRLLMASHLVDELKTYNNRNQFIDAGNIARTILRLFPKFMSDLSISSRIADTVVTVLASKGQSKISQAFEVNELLTLNKHCSNMQNCEEAVNYSLDCWEELFDEENNDYEEYSSEAIQYLLFHTVLTKDQLSRIRKSIVSHLENDEFVTSFQEESCRHSNDLYYRLPQGFSKKSIERSMTVASQTFDSDLAYLRWAVPKYGAETAQKLVTTVAESIGVETPEGTISDQLSRLIQIVELLLPESFSLDPIFTALAPHINAIADPDQKISLLSHFIQATQSVGVDVINLYIPIINQVASSAPSNTLQQILESLIQYHAIGADSKEVLNTISNRLVNEPSLRTDNDLISKYVQVCKKVNDEYVYNLIREIWETDEITGIFPVVIDVLNVTQGRKMLESLFNKTFEIGDAALMEQRIDLIKDHFSILKETHINRFREKLLNQWYASPEVSKRLGALKIWSHLLRIESSNGKKKFYDRILRYARERVASQSIGTPENRIYIDTLLGGSSFMSTTTANSFLDLCLEMVEEEKEDQMVSFGYSILASLPEKGFTAGKVNEALLRKIDFGSEPLEDVPHADLILDTILKRGQGKGGLSTRRADKLVANLKSQSKNELAAKFLANWAHSE